MRATGRWMWKPAAWFVAALMAPAAVHAQRIILLTENFDSLALGPAVDETPPSTNVWTEVFPAGWTVDDTGIPGAGTDQDGVTEWAGWAIARYDWWVVVAGDQNRSQFAKARGNVAIADPDEWDDIGHAEGKFNAYVKTPAINIGAIAPASLSLTFDSSWRPEGFDDGDQTNNQTAVISVSYDGGPAVEVLRWDSNPNGPFFKADATNETVVLPLNNPPGATSAVVTFALLESLNDWWWAIDNLKIGDQVTTVFSENFDTVPLGPPVEEPPPPTNVWTPTPPADWTVDRSGVPGVGDPNIGVTEWEGWSFAQAKWWAEVARDQGRVAFTQGTNIVAIADPDEWDDKGNPESLGTFNSFLSLPTIAIDPIGPNTLQLRFRSSWRDEDTQTAVITASYDGAAPVEVLRWESQPGPNFKDDATNEVVTVDLKNPIGARSVAIAFGLVNSTDDWWWAIDEVEVSGELSSDTILLLQENFDTVPLGPCVDENCPTGPANVWTPNPPAGWTVDRSGVAGVNDPAKGVTEWKGWSFARPEWWAFVAEDQRRAEFVLGKGVVAIADPDEWDDKGNPDEGGAATFNSFLTTRVIPLAGSAAGSLTLMFDSSWRDEDNQTATITVAYDGGAAVEVLRWESQPGANFHDDAPNETVTIPLNNPDGATSVVVRFGLTHAINNWWWAIDNLVVSNGNQTLFAENFDTLTLQPAVDEKPFPKANVWTKQAPAGWGVDDSGVPGAGTPDDGVTEWAGWSFADPLWWTTVAGDQNRSLFTKGKGGIAVADPDEWDDLPHAGGPYNAFLRTPPITMTGVQPKDIYIAFDSSWRPEDFQEAAIRISYDGGPEVEVLRWTSVDPAAVTFHPDAENESVLIPIANPRANTLVISFGLLEAGNDWWWAIDNLTVFALKPGSDPVYDYDADGDVDQEDYGVFQPCIGMELQAISPEVCLRSDYDLNLFIDGADLQAFVKCASGPSVPANKDCDN